jgi:hypothetical protein
MCAVVCVLCVAQGQQTVEVRPANGDAEISGEGFLLWGAMAAFEIHALSGGGFLLEGTLALVAEDCEEETTAADLWLRVDCSAERTVWPANPSLHDLDSTQTSDSAFGETLWAKTLIQLLSRWGMCEHSATNDEECEGDLDCDGLVGPADLQLLLRTW